MSPMSTVNRTEQSLTNTVASKTFSTKTTNSCLFFFLLRFIEKRKTNESESVTIHFFEIKYKKTKMADPKKNYFRSLLDIFGFYFHSWLFQTQSKSLNVSVWIFFHRLCWAKLNVTLANSFQRRSQTSLACLRLRIGHFWFRALEKYSLGLPWFEETR